MRSSIKRNKSLATAKRIAVAGMCMMATLPVFSQDRESGLTARKVFEQLQAPSLEILKKTTRLDMLDYWDADSIYRASNAVQGLSWLEKVTPDYLKVRVSPVSTLEIKLLPGKKEDVVMTVYTVGSDSQASDSQVDFYDTALNRLDTHKYFTVPPLKAFFDIPKGSSTTMKEIEEMIPFPTVEYSLSPENTDLTARLTVGEYMNLDDWNIAKLFLKPKVVTKWTGKYK